MYNSKHKTHKVDLSNNKRACEQSVPLSMETFAKMGRRYRRVCFRHVLVLQHFPNVELLLNTPGRGDTTSECSHFSTSPSSRSFPRWFHKGRAVSYSSSPVARPNDRLDRRLRRCDLVNTPPRSSLRTNQLIASPCCSPTYMGASSSYRSSCLHPSATPESHSP